jgi:hypothetical protein
MVSHVIKARGHPRVTARHRTTFMITKDPEVGPKGDCIIAVSLDKAGPDLPPELKRAIRSGRELLITLKAGGAMEKVRARGHSSLTLNHPRDLVVRKGSFTCGRTLAILANKAAADFSRAFVEILKNPETEVQISIIVR